MHCPAAACDFCLVSAGETHHWSRSTQSYESVMRRADPEKQYARFVPPVSAQAPSAISTGLSGLGLRGLTHKCS